MLQRSPGMCNVRHYLKGLRVVQCKHLCGKEAESASLLSTAGELATGEVLLLSMGH